ncbi:MAG TPA: anthranilate synthase component I [Aggregatilineales bacterium]|nr:anthranilate synthase component I [Aggregatilineales bacterium]
MTASPIAIRTPPARQYAPSFEHVERLFAGGDLVPVYRTLPADLETPVSVYLKLASSGDPSFLLESVEGGENVARYSFLGVRPAAIVTVHGREICERHGDQATMTELSADQDALHVIKSRMARFQPVVVPGLPRFVGGALGFLSYDLVRSFEKFPATSVDDLHLPEASVMLVDTLVIFDHVKHQLIVLSNAHNQGDPRVAYDAAIDRIERIVGQLKTPLPSSQPVSAPVNVPGEMTSNVTQAEFEANVRRAKEYIAAGDAFQIVLSQRLTRQTNAEPFAIYRALRMLNPSPYMFFLHFPADDLHVIGASPEMMIRYDADTRTAMVRPIAGTAPRGATPDADRELEDALRRDPKECAEHVMLVDLGRNDLGRVCEYGTVKVPQMMIIERFSHVMHIVSHVEGRLRKDLDAYDVLRASFPAGTLSGAPKIRAMQIIEELEGLRRGLYGGAIGYFSYDGSMDTCIAIRTLLMRGDTVYLQAGAGLVADSEPAREYQESLNKARALALAIEDAEQGIV